MLVDYQNVSIRPSDDFEILSGVDLQIEAGDFVFLLGKVGSGKTSLLRTLYAMRPVRGDKAEVLGYDMQKIRGSRILELRRKLGIIFQDFQLLPDRTVWSNLEFVLKATNWKTSLIAERINEVLHQVGLADMGHKFPHELSGGEQQRVAIARAILNKPQLIIADEPTGNLDSETSTQILKILIELREQGSAVIMSTHNRSLLTLAQDARVLACEDGQLNAHPHQSEPVDNAD